MAYQLYRGNWPQNVSKLAKYATRLVDGVWKVTVLYEIGRGLKYLAVDEDAASVVERVHQIKASMGNDAPGGAFYINEYRHLLVPVRGDPSSGTGSHYYFGGLVQTDFTFRFEGELISGKPEGLRPGDPWRGPRPGIPYVLAAGGSDIYYESPALTDDDPPQIRPLVTRQVFLSRVRGAQVAREAARPILEVKGQKGGRFYVNEYGAIFAPTAAGDGNGVDYIYCGTIDRDRWFPEPQVPNITPLSIR